MTALRVLTAVLLCTGTLEASGATAPPAPTPFDSRTKHRERGAISVVPRDVDRMAPNDELRTRWQRFRERT